MERNKTILLPDFGKTPPYSQENELAVLGILMTYPESMNDIASILRPEMFYRDSHQRIFEACLNVFKRINKTDLITVTQELINNGNIDNCGGIMYVTNLCNISGSYQMLEHYALIVKQKYLQREYLRVGHEIQHRASDDMNDVSEIANYAETNLLEISDKIHKKEPIKLGKLVDIVIDNIQKLINHEIALTGIPTGFTKMDRVTGGFKKKELIIIAGRPGMGKSALALQIAKNTAELKNEVGFFSCEMSDDSLARRYLSNVSGKSNVELLTAHCNIDHLLQTSEQLLTLGIYIDDTSNISLVELRSKVRKLILKYGIKIVVVDYLQLMKGEGQSREQEVSSISRGLKAIAKDMDIPVIALSQLNRESETRKDKRPQLSDLRESGCLHGDTKIYCPHLKSNIRIKDLIYQNDFNIFATTLTDNRIMKAKKCFKTGNKQVFEITLLNGQNIKATANHKFLTPDGWKAVYELRDGGSIAIPLGIENEESNIKDSEIRLLGHFLSNGSCLKGQPIRVALNQLDDDLAQKIMNDAIDCTENRVMPKVVLTNTEKSKFATVFFKPTFHLTHGKTSPIADIMRKYKLFDVRTKDKFIPEQFFFMSKRQICILLSALFTGDGTVYYREYTGRKSLTISYSSASIQLIKDIQHLLLNVGIVSFITDVQNKKNQKWQNLNISGKANIELFVNNIGFLSQRKNDIMIEGWNRSKDNLAGWNKYQYNENRSLCFMPIKRITAIGFHDVYDIEVDEYHNFIADGIIAHNSIEQDADMVLLVYRPAYYKIQTVTSDNVDISTEGLMIVDIAKNRNGAIGQFDLKHNISLTDIFEEVEPF
jgi:replicative DNA helicase